MIPLEGGRGISPKAHLEKESALLGKRKEKKEDFSPG